MTRSDQACGICVELRSIDKQILHRLPFVPDEVCQLFAQYVSLRGHFEESPLFLSSSEELTNEEIAGLALVRMSTCFGEGQTWFATDRRGFELFLHNIHPDPKDDKLVKDKLAGFEELIQNGLIESRMKRYKGHKVQFYYPTPHLLLMFYQQTVKLNEDLIKWEGSEECQTELEETYSFVN